MKKYRIVSDTRTNYKGKIFEFVENASISLEQIQDPKTPYHAPIFHVCPTYPMKAAFTGNKKRKNACKVALCSQMQLGVCLHFRAISTNTSSPRGLYHHKHGFLIDKLPIPPFLINKIFTHLIFTLPKYPSPIHPITPLFSRPIYHT